MRLLPDCQLKERCLVCGEQADALWSGKKTIAVCGNCAEHVLPGLIAEAISLPAGGGAYYAAKAALVRVERRFWMVFAARSLRSGERCTSCGERDFLEAAANRHLAPLLGSGEKEQREGVRALVEEQVQALHRMRGVKVR